MHPCRSLNLNSTFEFELSVLCDLRELRGDRRVFSGLPSSGNTGLVLLFILLAGGLATQEIFYLIGAGFGVGFSDLDQSREVVGLEHEHRQDVGALGFLGSESAGHELERGWQPDRKSTRLNS